MVFSISQTPIGVGKESDVYVVATPPEKHLTENVNTTDADAAAAAAAITYVVTTTTDAAAATAATRMEQQGSEQAVLKIHRLGRICFRSLKRSRDYLRNNRIAKTSWLQLSRLSAHREASFMKALYQHGFPVPKLISQSRHTVLMTLHRAPPLRNLQHCPDIPELWGKLMELLVKFGQHGLVHGDFNEFNILCYEGTTEVVVIDFPQMVSVDHPNAEEMWERDLHGLARWFERRWGWVVDRNTLPSWEGDVMRVVRKRIIEKVRKGKKRGGGKECKNGVGAGSILEEQAEGPVRLDSLVDATGFSKQQLKALENAIREQQEQDGESGKEDDEGEDEDITGASEGDNKEEEEEEDDDGVVLESKTLSEGNVATTTTTEAIPLLEKITEKTTTTTIEMVLL